MRTLLLTVDALRADHLRQYGYNRETMPVIDRLESGNGTRYEAAFANGTYTGISLPSMLSSQYLGQAAASDGPNLATALADAGVTTAAFHSNTMFASAVGEVAGFDRFEDFGVLEAADDESANGVTQRAYDALIDVLRPMAEGLGVRGPAERIQETVFPASMIHDPSVYTDAETTTDAALEWLRDAPEDAFCWIHYMDPHRPYGIDIEEPAFADRPADPEEIRELMSTAGIHPDRVTAEQRQRMIDLYDSDLRYTSDAIDRLLDGLIEDGVWEETALIFTADHGEEFAEHGQYFHRNLPYDELLRVPLYVKPPAAAEDAAAGVLNDPGRGVVMDERELLDVAPTVCRLHGADVPDSFQGETLATGPPRRVVASGSFTADGHVVAARWEGWKYITLRAEDEEELYDLREDPGEQDDRADDEPSRCHAIRSEIPTNVLEGEPTDVGEVDNEATEQRLRDLGYLE